MNQKLDISRSGRFFEVISVDAQITLNSSTLLGGFFGAVITSSTTSDNSLNISGDYLMLDSASESPVIVGLEFPGAPSLGLITMNPGDFIRQPYLSVRVIGAKYAGKLRFQHGRGDFSILPAGQSTGGGAPNTVSGVQYVIASDGVSLPNNSLAQTYAFTGTDLTSVTVVYLGNSYRQSYTYSGGNIATQSQWVKL